MTETDTSRVERPCPNFGVTLNGWSGLRYCGHYVTHAHTDCINNLRHRAEKAEAERDTAPAAGYARGVWEAVKECEAWGEGRMAQMVLVLLIDHAPAQENSHD